MTSDIIRKLEAEIHRGIMTEVQVVYLMVAVRKLLEQKKAKEKYRYLTFYCDWTLHSKLCGPMAQKILKLFDAANVHLVTGVELRDLPGELRSEIDRISKMNLLQHELRQFLEVNGLPGLEVNHSDGWGHFLYLYARVVEDCPLMIAAKSSTIAKVTLHVELGNKPVEGETLFKVTWRIWDKNGLCGDVFVINSFSLCPP